MGDEGNAPYCEECQKPVFDSFSTCVILLPVTGEEAALSEACLIRQSYGDTSRFVCVAGFMKPGETAEEAARRELLEEVGLEARSLQYVQSYAYPGRDTLMLGFSCQVDKRPFQLSGEVAEARWFSYSQGAEALSESYVAQKLFYDVFSRQMK